MSVECPGPQDPFSSFPCLPPTTPASPCFLSEGHGTHSCPGGLPLGYWSHSLQTLQRTGSTCELHPSRVALIQRLMDTEVPKFGALASDGGGLEGSLRPRALPGDLPSEGLWTEIPPGLGFPPVLSCLPHSFTSLPGSLFWVVSQVICIQIFISGIAFIELP